MIEALLQAERLLIHGMVDQAEQIYTTASQRDPRNSIAVVGLARVALERGDERLAYERACAALAIDPENAAALRLEARLSEVFAARGEPVERPRFVDVGERPANTQPTVPPEAPIADPDARPSERIVFTRNPSMAEHQSMEEDRQRASEATTGQDEAPPAQESQRRPGLWRRLFGDSSDEAKP
ncbi:MAG TPA: tetratricopeptide repeat protein [Candidatus Limnocylindrales bacterium]|nr:tetratricopeptide repeat protein [Candidatus Limnocylindrales bacterium]